jgi:hypothetical protein
MHNPTTILAALLCCFFLPNQLLAQTTFQVFPSVAWVVAPPSSFDNPAKAKIVNRTNAEITIRWQRILQPNGIPPGIYTQVCDPNLCYPATINTRTFTIAPLDTGNIDLHFVNETGLIVDPAAEGFIKVANVTNPADSFIVRYRYTTNPLISSKEPAFPNARLFPNPATDFFQLEGVDQLSGVSLRRADGTEVQRFVPSPVQKYIIPALPAGLYFVQIEDKKRRLQRLLPIWML